MSSRQRIHVPGGTYYVFQRAGKHPIFQQPDDYAQLEGLLAEALLDTGARVHAYCWTPEGIHLAVQIEEIAVGHLMQRFTARYARCMQERMGERGHFFQDRYCAMLIDPDVYLLKLVHYIHYIPVLEGLVQSPDEYSHSSHRAYLGAVHVPWLDTRTVLRLLDSCDEDRVAYRKFMSLPPAPQVVELFKGVGPNTQSTLGNPEVVEEVTHRASRSRRSRMTLDQISYYVCCLLEVSREEILSISRVRKFVLARAVIAWHADRRGVATRAEVARYLGRGDSNLSKRISHYKELQRELFKLDAFSHLIPIAEVNHRGDDRAVEGDDATGGRADRKASAQECETGAAAPHRRVRTLS